MLDCRARRCLPGLKALIPLTEVWFCKSLLADPVMGKFLIAAGVVLIVMGLLF